MIQVQFRAGTLSVTTLEADLTKTQVDQLEALVIKAYEIIHNQPWDEVKDGTN